MWPLLKVIYQVVQINLSIASCPREFLDSLFSSIVEGDRLQEDLKLKGIWLFEVNPMLTNNFSPNHIWQAFKELDCLDVFL